jgi:hypothetical protein
MLRLAKFREKLREGRRHGGTSSVATQEAITTFSHHDFLPEKAASVPPNGFCENGEKPLVSVTSIKREPSYSRKEHGIAEIF